jgi:hypothetical protein
MLNIKEYLKRVQIKNRFALLAKTGAAPKRCEFTIAEALQNICDNALLSPAISNIRRELDKS